MSKEIEILKNYINGQFVESKSTEFVNAMNPATDEILAKVPLSTKEECYAAVEAAKKAFPMWRNTPGIKRIQPILRLTQLLKDKMEDISVIGTMNHGKEIAALRGEVVRAYQMCEAAVGVPEMQKGEFMQDIAEGIDEYTILEPLGVFLMIPPFNFPAMIPFWTLPFAVAAGNTFIVKINEQTPLAMQRIIEWCIDKAGFPPGVVNFIHGGPQQAIWLIEHPDIVGVSSVGSTPVAKDIYKRATSLGKRAMCHGGANNFLVIDQTANLNKIMNNLMNSCFGNTGQRCLAGSVIMVVGPEEYYQKVKAKFIDAAKKLKVGYGLDSDTFMGPVVSRKALEKLKSQIQECVDAGAKMLLDGRDIKVEGYPNGYWLGPTIMEGLKPGFKWYDDEIFGPVVMFDRADTLDEAIKIINANPKGNAVTIYTESGENARHFRHEVNCGNIGINIGIVAPIAWFPFAGAKESFFGTLRAQGREAVQFFTQARVIIERFHGSTKIEWD
ncbi:MAG: CoA-acylating methylmalonate-semialdehyde dehydrogenase [Promethearchaeota archaeon]